MANKAPNPMKRLYTLLGIILFLMLGAYGYTLLTEYKSEEMEAMEKAVRKKAKALAGEAAALAERAIREGFKPEEVKNCRNVVTQYQTPDGWEQTDRKVNMLIGIRASSSHQDMEERCIYFAKVVAAMERVSHHERHVFVCGESTFNVSGAAKLEIRPDPKGRGVIHNMEGKRDDLLLIKPGRSTVLQHWQLFNVGDGCMVVGMSRSAGTLKMSGSVARVEE